MKTNTKKKNLYLFNIFKYETKQKPNKNMKMLTTSFLIFFYKYI